MSSEDILEQPAPAADARLAYGSDPNQFGEIRLPQDKGPFPIVMNLHGGFWKARYDLLHAGHLCAALTQKGLATWNVEYRRVGNPGAGWPGSFEDIRNAYRFLAQLGKRYHLDSTKVLVMGHSAGGQLALCLAAHEPALTRVLSLAGVVDLDEAGKLHLGDNAVVAFLGGTASAVPEHYREADPMAGTIPGTVTQWLIHGATDTVVPSYFSRKYAELKKRRGEDVHYLEIATADHFDLIDPHSRAWPKVESTVLHMMGE
ncbi:MAG TPA: alpha/beta hydrolase [Terriglobales bacterium]|nr:alpha/beta hydrolase [Terriglobales bacterium]